MSIRKADYIAKFGEEAWEIEAKKRREYKKQWYQNNKESVAEWGKQYREANKERIAEWGKQYREGNKERIAERGKQYREGNKERIAEWKKQYYQDNKERITERKKQYYQDNKERITEQVKQYYEDNKEFVAERQKQYRSTQLGRAKSLKTSYIQKDNEKGFSTDQNIDEDWIIENIFKSQCIYCGESDWTKLGCDRIDNTKGHTPDNIVCACEKCNKDRSDKFTVEEFIQYRKLHPREEQVPEADDKVINAWIGKIKVSSKNQ